MMVGEASMHNGIVPEAVGRDKMHVQNSAAPNQGNQVPRLWWCRTPLKGVPGCLGILHQIVQYMIELCPQY
jgi:hypothetical protein